MLFFFIERPSWASRFNGMTSTAAYASAHGLIKDPHVQIYNLWRMRSLESEH